MSNTIHCRIDRRKIEKAVTEQKVQGSRILLADTDCTGLRLALNAKSASWTYAYRKRGYDTGGKRFPQRTLRLGDLVTMTPQEARMAADVVKAQVRDGLDPATLLFAAKEKQLEAERQNNNIQHWMDNYKLSVLRINTKYHKDEFMHLRLALDEMQLKKLKVHALTANKLRELLRCNEHRPSTARHRFGSVSRFLDYLVDEAIIERNPAFDVSRRHRPKPSPPRQKHFNTHILQKLWDPAGELKPVYLNYLRFMITTPLRRDEASELRFSSIDFDKSQIEISSELAKNDEFFIMPLCNMATKLIQHLETNNNSRVFPLSSLSGEPMTAWSHFHTQVRRATGVSDFSLHHLRRTVSTLTSEHSDFSESLIDSLLNHKQSATRQGVMRNYQHAKNVTRRRAVMAWWSDFLKGEVSNGKDL